MNKCIIRGCFVAIACGVFGAILISGPAYAGDHADTVQIKPESRAAETG